MEAVVIGGWPRVRGGIRAGDSLWLLFLDRPLTELVNIAVTKFY
jgi:hypothetical protein